MKVFKRIHLEFFLGYMNKELTIVDYFVNSSLAPTMVASCGILNIILWLNLLHYYELQTRLDN